ncbi:hypothetical protein [Prosthecobacter sp.]|uniref:hypothetical protein n=1 Tax=Prosthecobacter sp. TaxID=1965333 RepID=UPI002ABBCFF1|nr:hypothetical protein [Prosthecobacter sp.]MDZ4405805.1 hypothetical protein [Prosthecobacter sp.]
MQTTAPSPPDLPDLKVAVFSCDLYCDMWPLFFHFLFKHWPDVPTPVYLLTNHLSYDDPRVITVKVGEDTSWTDGIARGLAQVPSEYVFCFLDDFMLTKPMPVQRLADVYHPLKNQDGNWVCLRPKAPAPENDPPALIAPITDAAQSAGFHAGIWRTTYLQKLCAEVQLNIWHTEGHIRKLIRGGRAEKLFYMTENAAGLVSYIEVVKRFWQKDGIDYVRANNIRPDLWRRPYPPQGDNVFARFIRSILKRYVRLRSSLETKRLLKENNGVVSSAVRFIKAEN